MNTSSLRIERNPFSYCRLDSQSNIAMELESRDWSRTTFGPIGDWPNGLISSLTIMMNSSLPMWLCWGVDCTFFYNDEFADQFFDRGDPPRICMSANLAWPEGWNKIRSSVVSVMQTGCRETLKDLLICKPYFSGIQESYSSLSCSPCVNDSGNVEGVLCVIHDETKKVLGARRMAAVRRLASLVTTGQISGNGNDPCQRVLKSLAENQNDFSFMMIYKLSENGRVARRAACHGLPQDSLSSPSEICIDQSPWPLRTALQTAESVVVETLPEHLEQVSGGAWPETARQAIVLPIKIPSNQHVAGFAIMGINPRLELDEEYIGFFEMLTPYLGLAVEQSRTKTTTSPQQTDNMLASEDRFRTIADAAPVLIWLSGTDKLCNGFNKPWLEVVGRPLERELGNGWTENVHPDDFDRCLKIYVTNFDERRAFSMEYRLKRHDGEYRWILDNGVPYYGPNGIFEGYIGSCIDIHTAKLAEEALVDANRRKDEFLATLAHELRNPLAPLRTGLTILKLSKDNEQAADQARQMMERQLAQMVRLIDDLLDVSRISRGKLELKLQQVSLETIVRNAVESVRPFIDEAKHALAVAIPPQLILIRGDMARLTQVFCNLLHNAAKFTERGGRIELTANTQEDRIVIAIKDNGRGIPPTMIPRIFDLFTRVDRGHDRFDGGLGIGLSIAKRLVEMHGGNIDARSDGKDTGAEFIITLPYIADPRPEHTKDNVSSPTQSGLRRILVVDDNHEAASSLAFMLKLIGNETQTANDGLEALEIAEMYQPDVFLLDIGMPRMDGFETARRIRQKSWGKTALIIAVSGWGQEEDRRNSRAAGFDHHLTKPVDPDHLLVLLNRHQSRRVEATSL